MALDIVLTYDISSNTTRARVAAMVSSWGNRIQRSVYYCQLNPNDLDDLLKRIESAINHQTDSVQVFQQCANCWDSSRQIGQATLPSPEPYWIL